MGDLKAVGRIGGKTLLWFFSASLISLALGAVLVNLYQPGHQLQLEMPDQSASIGLEHQAITLKGFVTHIFPSSVFDAMAKNEILFDLDCEWMNMAEARKLAQRHPDLQIVLEHIGFPRKRTDAYFENWKKAVKDLAKADNVTMKISGVAMTDPQFSKKSLKPWVDTCVNAFGPERCVIGSNWPVDRLFSSFDVIMNFYREYIDKLSTSEQKKILNKNASKLYKF